MKNMYLSNKIIVKYQRYICQKKCSKILESFRSDNYKYNLPCYTISIKKCDIFSLPHLIKICKLFYSCVVLLLFFLLNAYIIYL